MADVSFFSLRDVRLLDGPFKHAESVNRAYLLSLDPDRLLYHFRVNAGLPSLVQPYGGWEAADWDFPGHTLGHYLSACALMAAHGDEPEFQRRVDYIVAELAKCQDALAKKASRPGFLDPLPEERFARLEAGDGGGGVPYYTMHKTMAGLIDAYEQAHNAQSLDVMKKLAGWLKFRVDRLTVTQLQHALRIEPGGINEALANLYAITRDPDHLQLAKAFNHQLFFEPFIRGEDPLGPGAGSGRLLHGNTQVPKALGAAREYEITGDETYRTVAMNFWRDVALTRTFIFGGNTDAERFFKRGTESHHLTATTAEGCNTYNMLKLTRHLFAWQPGAETMDFYERALYNHILATQHPATGGIIYFLSAQPGFRKLYGTAENTFWCCTGSGMENHTKYADTIYAHEGSSLYINLFIASELRWVERGINLRQDTKFPEEDRTELTLRLSKPQSFTLKFRDPSWSGPVELSINGKRQPIELARGSYVTIDREWRDGDRVALRFPMSLRVNPLADDPSLVAFTYGPIVLAGDLGHEGLALKAQEVVDNGKDPRGPRMPEAPVFAPGLVTTAAEVVSHLAAVPGKPLTFATHDIGRPGDVTLIPLNRVVDENYTIYWKLTNEAGWEKILSAAAPMEATRQARDARITDAVWAGNERMEEAHNVSAANAPVVSSRMNLFRDATHGSVGWKLNGPTDGPMTLRLGFADAATAAFDVVADGRTIAEERPSATLTPRTGKPRPAATAVKTYSLPAASKGRSTVEIKIVGHSELGTAHIVFCELSKAAP